MTSILPQYLFVDFTVSEGFSGSGLFELQSTNKINLGIPKLLVRYA